MAPISTRRAVVRGALLATVGSVVAVGPITAAVNPTPIMAAAIRLSQLSGLDENDLTDEQFDAVTREQLKLQYLITDTAPQSVSDAVVLLMIAAAEISRKALKDDGSFGHEHGEIVVRRVLHFLGDGEGLNLDDVGGAFFLPWAEQEALALKDYTVKLQTGSQSTLSPLAQYDLAKSQFQAVSGAAAAGDATSASQLTSYIDNYLSTSQAVNGSGAVYAADFSKALDALKNVTNNVDALTNSFVAQQLQTQTESITAAQQATTDQIAALRREMQQMIRALAA